MTELNKQATKEQLNSWFTKGGGGIVAGVILMFGNSFMEKQDEILAEMKRLNTAALESKADREAIRLSMVAETKNLDLQLAKMRDDIEETSNYTQEQWKRLRNYEQRTIILKNAFKAVCDTTTANCVIDFPAMEPF